MIHTHMAQTDHKERKKETLHKHTHMAQTDHKQRKRETLHTHTHTWHNQITNTEREKQVETHTEKYRNSSHQIQNVWH